MSYLLEPSMRPFLNGRMFVIVLAMLAAFIAPPTAGQSAETQAYSQDELDQLLAPIALYPDDLLTQILVAATYPLEVVQAARFVARNPNLGPTALDDAVAAQNWDASVQSLTAFPQVLAMMDDKLGWTERLGDAFLADPQRVMDTVQSLRRRAEAAGYLSSTPQQRVIEEDQVIVIEPARPDIVYVPVYDPLVVYGPWWAPGYPPWFWYPPSIYGYPVIVTAVAFGVGWAVWRDHWGWGRPDWHHHRVVLDTGHSRFWHDRPNRPSHAPGETWQHSPYHRRGVPYADAQTRERFQPVSPGAVRERQNYRGYAAPTAPSGATGSAPAGSPARAFAPAPATPPGASARAIDQPARAPAAAVQPPSPKQAEAPVVRQPQAPIAQPQGSIAPPPPVSQPQAPIVRQAPVAPQYNAPRAPSPSIFDPGVSRSQAQVNAQRGMQSLGSPAAPAIRAPSAPAPAIRAPSAPAPAMRAPSMPAPAMRAPSPPAPVMRAPSPAPRAAPAPPAPPARGR